jgi:heat shock protein HspQ
MKTHHAKFSVGQLVHHQLFGYRGVIIDVDPTFQSSDEWYEAVARSRPPKDRPWYHVLVHDATHRTYVAERNLEPDESREPITHPELDSFVGGLRDGAYSAIRGAN